MTGVQPPRPTRLPRGEALPARAAARFRPGPAHRRFDGLHHVARSHRRGGSCRRRSRGRRSDRLRHCQWRNRTPNRQWIQCQQCVGIMPRADPKARRRTRSAIGPSQCRLVGQHLGARAACRRERRRTEDPEAGIARVVGRTSGTHSRPRARVHRNGCHRHHVDASALFSEAEPGWATVARPDSRLDSLLEGFAAHKPAVRTIDLTRHVCPSGPPCPLLVDGIWVRGDGEHYTIEGSIWVARWLAPQIGVSALRQVISPLPTITVVLPEHDTKLKGPRAGRSNLFIQGGRDEGRVSSHR